jgi:histidinol-phosphate phosphatase family protein
MTSAALQYAVVVPTVGRPSLQRLLESLAAQDGPAPQEVLVVDDRRDAGSPLTGVPAAAGDLTVRVLTGGGRGPAAARNLGWRATTTGWVVFLDDDVELPAGWAKLLARDLADCDETVGGSQGRLRVPLPSRRRPTDWERGTAGLADARWATADMAYRRAALLAVHGFDERFPRAYREDADLALRVRRAGWRLVRGRRTTVHPVRPVDDWVSLRVQAGNADDALMRQLHGRRWRVDAQTGRGRLRWHAATTAAGLTALAAAVARRPRLAATAALAWAGLTGEFAWRRIAPGPRSLPEVRRMALTSAVIPPAALWHRLRGQWRHRFAPPWPPPVRGVLFDRDGTLVHDVPYNDDPALVRPVDGAADALRRLRRAGVRVGVVTNQSGVGRGLLTAEQVADVNAAVDAALGPFDTWQVCVHAPDDGCGCRKPQPGMVVAGAEALGVDVRDLAVVGDIGADVAAARAAGARAVLVPNRATRPEEVASAPVVAPDLATAVDLLLTPHRAHEGVGRQGVAR